MSTSASYGQPTARAPWTPGRVLALIGVLALCLVNAMMCLVPIVVLMVLPCMLGTARMAHSLIKGE